jgi:hypothetical protein
MIEILWRPGVGGAIRIAALSALLLGLTGCEDKETDIARCQVEAYKALGAASLSMQTDYIKNCMRIVGYKYESAICASGQISLLWPSCFTPTGLIARAAEALSGRK